ncbi:peptidyl-prolyl cis-trans isomerase FKBP13, chloroplastic [Herrania umbratica]|uniref:peptidylprolyl isomerase n=1 Tax=Herrania umbratica TaxID=108875 RepID=A0A6J1B9Z7_9ROSI|nr:peptidyl-prolyl cis-trans isomerase FKBP13, chloroplastic [Herrania umbratica]
MSSLPFAVGTYSPRNLSKPHSKLLTKNVDKAVTSIKWSSNKQSISPTEQLNGNPGAFKRREAVGFGLCFGLLEAGLLQLSQPSAAAEEAPCELTLSPSGLGFCDKVVGKGPEAVKGQLIKAHYVGRLESGKVFDSSYNRGKPLTFRIGVGEVIKGWDQGILGGDGVPPMLAGGKRTLRLPPELGYGTRGAGCKGGSCIIPPDSVLLFDVEFIGKA